MAKSMIFTATKRHNLNERLKGVIFSSRSAFMLPPEPVEKVDGRTHNRGTSRRHRYMVLYKLDFIERVEAGLKDSDIGTNIELFRDVIRDSVKVGKNFAQDYIKWLN